MNRKLFFIADTHFGHSNIIKFDNRPFENIDEMETILIQNWNNTVTEKDIVYILGDFCWSRSESEWIRILKLLNGQKVLIKGNHDLKQMSATLKNMFADIKEYKEIKENGIKIIMSHYPIPFYRGSFNENTFMLHGHVHETTLENNMLKQLLDTMQVYKETYPHDCNKVQIYNVGCMTDVMKYTPRTLNEIVGRKVFDE